MPTTHVPCKRLLRARLPLGQSGPFWSVSVLQGFVKAASLSWFRSFNDIVSRSWLKGSLSQIQRYSNTQLSFQSWLYIRKCFISRQQRRPFYISSCLAYQRRHLSDNFYSLILPCSYSHDHLSLVTTVTFGKWVWPRYFYSDTGEPLLLQFVCESKLSCLWHWVRSHLK